MHLARLNFELQYPDYRICLGDDLTMGLRNELLLIRHLRPVLSEGWHVIACRIKEPVLASCKHDEIRQIYTLFRYLTWSTAKVTLQLCSEYQAR